MTETFTQRDLDREARRGGRFRGRLARLRHVGERARRSRTFGLVRDLDNPAHYMSFAPWDGFESQAARRALDEFPERIGRVRAHCSEFTPFTFELVTQVG